MELLSQLAVDGGHILNALIIDEHRCVCVSRLRQLAQIVVDPLKTEDRLLRERDPDLLSTYHLRQQLQRPFDGAKRKNLESYKNYVIRLAQGGRGAAPTIMLYCSESLPMHRIPDSCFGLCQIPYGARVVAVDGETQYASRLLAARENPALLDKLVVVDITHGVDLPHGQQMFHDLNMFGIKPNAALAVARDTADSITALAREIETQVFPGKVNATKRRLSASDAEFFTLNTLRVACLCFVDGIRGVTRTAATNIEIPADTIDDVTHQAKQWFQRIAEKFAAQFADRDRSLIGRPASMAAIGAVGHFVLAAKPELRELIGDHWLAEMGDVDWLRSAKWDGIAGKVAPSGALTIGGTKECAYGIFRALTQNDSPIYSRIRRNQPVIRELPNLDQN